MRSALIILALLFTQLSLLHADELTFTLKKTKVLSISLKEIKKGNLSVKTQELKKSDMKLFNVFRGYERTYEGYELFSFLDAVYGSTWRSHNKITFIAQDGYRQMALISSMLDASKGKNGYLAYGEKGTQGFTLVEKEGKKIDPAPIYLVWTNFSQTDKASHGDVLKWPYQLVSIDID